MKTIPLSRGLSAIVDDTDYDWLMKWSWCAMPVKHGGKGFYAIRTERRLSAQNVRYSHTILMHREIVGAADGVKTDHKDRNSLNNQRENLREATSSQNQANIGLTARNTSGFKGVVWSKARHRWQGRITVNKKSIFLGSFDSPVDAAHVYDDAAKKYFGEFAFANFPTTAKQKL